MIDLIRNQSSRKLRRVTIVALVAVIISPMRTAAAAQAPDDPPVTLRALLDSIRARHPTIEAAASRVRAATASAITARAFGNPVLSAQIDQTPLPGGRSLVGIDRETIITATMPLEALYQRGSRVARANANTRAAEADALATRQRVGLDAVGAYFRSAMAQVQLATTRELVSWLDSLVVYNRARVNEGVAAESDVIRSELERDRMSAEAAMQHSELAQARASLGAFLGTARMRASPMVAVDEMPLAFPATLLAGTNAQSAGDEMALSQSIDARQDIRAARERVTASTAAVATERSMRVRQLGATVGTMRSTGQTSMIVGLMVPLPVFDPNRGEIQRASAERDAASFELAGQHRLATAEVRGAFDAARILTDRVAILARRDADGFLARADESRRIALGAYREGAVPLYQVIDAARAWADARVTYYRTVLAQQQSVLTLVVATGGDLFATPLPLGGTAR